MDFGQAANLMTAMNIVGAKPYQPLAVMMRRECWPASHSMGIIAEIGGEGLQWVFKMVRNDFRKVSWSPSVEDACAEDWVCVDDVAEAPSAPDVVTMSEYQDPMSFEPSSEPKFIARLAKGDRVATLGRYIVVADPAAPPIIIDPDTGEVWKFPQ